MSSKIARACALLSLVPLFACAQPALPLSDVASFSKSRLVFTQQGGETIYRAVCQGCHMAQGEGAKGAGFFPALAANARLSAAGYPVHVVMNGLHGMPGFAQRLDDQQVADVVNFVRTSFGNAYTQAVTAQEVEVFRPNR
jgi:mono/diheme cytochrome c family protein